MRRIRLAAEYGCEPIWNLETEPPTNLTTGELALGADLSARIDAWSARFQQTLEQAYPPYSGFDTKAQADAFDEEGRALARQMERAFDGIVSVEYVPSATIKIK